MPVELEGEYWSRCSVNGDGHVQGPGVEGQAIGQMPDCGLGSGDRFVLADVGRPQWVAGLAELSAQFSGRAHREGVAQDPVDLRLATAAAEVWHRRPISQAVGRRVVWCNAGEIQRIGMQVGIEPDQIGTRAGAVGEHDRVDGVRVGTASVARHAGEFGSRPHQNTPTGRHLRQCAVAYGQNGHGWLIFLKFDWCASRCGRTGFGHDRLRGKREGFLQRQKASGNQQQQQQQHTARQREGTKRGCAACCIGPTIGPAAGDCQIAVESRRFRSPAV